MKTGYALCTLFGAGLIASQVQAGITFEDDFENYALGDTPSPTNVWVDAGPMTVTNGGVWGSQWVNNVSTGGWGFATLDMPDAAVMTLSFDAYFDTADFGDGYMRMNMVGDLGNLNRLDWGRNWDMRKGTEFSMDKVQHFDVVMNQSGATVAYNGTTIDHNSFAVWVEGSLASPNAGSVGPGGEYTMDQADSENNTLITRIGLWVNSAAVQFDNIEVRDEAYVIQYPWDTVFDYEFDGTDDNTVFSNLGGWDSLNQWGFGFINTNAAGARLVHRPGSTEPEFEVNKKGWNWRGVLHTNGLGRAVVTNETIEFKMDYTLFAHPARETRNGIDFFLTTNNTALADNTAPYEASQQYFGSEPEAQMGFRTKQLNWDVGGDWPDGGFGVSLDPARASDVQVSMSLNAIGVSNLTGGAADIESTPMTITYTAQKTTNSGIWRVGVEVLDANGGVLQSYSDSSYTNQVLYDAVDIYFGMYAYHNAEGEEGAEMDNMRLRILDEAEPVYTAYEDFLITYGILGESKTADGDADGLNNWGEYVFGGNPTNGNDVGTQPVFDADTGNYIFHLIGDHSVIAHVQETDDLVLGTWSTIGTVAVSETNRVLNAYTNNTGSAENKKFLKLLVD
ncbi:hypothetical protein [Pontiella agarivorans]|uniref:Uncharacterized protein n=1 Tax=Pontiella agarivorans TaxID=3038953 RepID=A0ABU5MU82_9BACT|nr:hypothetical protein [Pontiella agarivorans]MDZ8117773.1 hypothetical protein [Pontiella agarivorans]